jgi:hypothetical protein
MEILGFRWGLHHRLGDRFGKLTDYRKINGLSQFSHKYSDKTKLANWVVSKGTITCWRKDVAYDPLPSKTGTPGF